MKNLILTALFLCFLNSCTKDSATSAPVDTLPPISTIGANTAGCIINGKVLIPKNGINGISGFPVYGLKYYTGIQFGQPFFNDYFALKISNLESKSLNYSIYIHLNNISAGLGNYIVNQSNGNNYNDSPDNPHIIVSEFNNNIFTGESYYSSNNSGLITITRFDYPNKIISGTFSATLYNKDNPSEKIQVTDGRFDINLVTLNN